jgi:hypothetical protein
MHRQWYLGQRCGLPQPGVRGRRLHGTMRARHDAVRPEQQRCGHVQWERPVGPAGDMRQPGVRVGRMHGGVYARDDAVLRQLR